MKISNVKVGKKYLYQVPECVAEVFENHPNITKLDHKGTTYTDACMKVHNTEVTVLHVHTDPDWVRVDHMDMQYIVSPTCLSKNKPAWEPKVGELVLVRDRVNEHWGIAKYLGSASELSTYNIRTDTSMFTSEPYVMCAPLDAELWNTTTNSPIVYPSNAQQ